MPQINGNIIDEGQRKKSATPVNDETVARRIFLHIFSAFCQKLREFSFLSILWFASKAAQKKDWIPTTINSGNTKFHQTPVNRERRQRKKVWASREASREKKFYFGKIIFPSHTSGKSCFSAERTWAFTRHETPSTPARVAGHTEKWCKRGKKRARETKKCNGSFSGLKC